MVRTQDIFCDLELPQKPFQVPRENLLPPTSSSPFRETNWFSLFDKNSLLRGLNI
jgi:hypothetical protein